MNSVYSLVKNFKRKHPGTIAWRTQAHCQIIERHLNPGETVQYAFACQKNIAFYDIFSTYVVALTDKRIMLAQKRLLFGYLFLTITPELYNDLTVRTGLLWGNINIDTVKETVHLSNISKDALPEIETQITEFMMQAKKEYSQQ